MAAATAPASTKAPGGTSFAEKALGVVGAGGTALAIGQTAGNLMQKKEKKTAVAGVMGNPIAKVAAELRDMVAAPASTAPAAAAATQPADKTHLGRPAPGKLAGTMEYINEHIVPPATAFLTIGGAGLTAKGIYDSIRAEKDRTRMMSEAALDRDAANSRETEFHAARMRLIDNAGKSRIPQQAAPLLNTAHDQATGLSMDPGTGKVGNFNPRLPEKPKIINIVRAPEGPGLMDSLETIAGPQLQHNMRPISVDFDHSLNQTLRV